MTPRVLGFVPFTVVREPHVFMSEAALGLAADTTKDSSARIESWWTQLNGEYFIQMQRAHGERMSWTKVGLNYHPEYPQDIEKARLDAGGRQVQISYDDYDGYRPVAAVMGQDSEKMPTVTYIIHFQRETHSSRRKQDQAQWGCLLIVCVVFRRYGGVSIHQSPSVLPTTCHEYAWQLLLDQALRK